MNGAGCGAGGWRLTTSRMARPTPATVRAAMAGIRLLAGGRLTALRCGPPSTISGETTVAGRGSSGGSGGGGGAGAGDGGLWAAPGAVTTAMVGRGGGGGGTAAAAGVETAVGVAAAGRANGTADPERMPAVEAALLGCGCGALAAALGPTWVGRCGIRG